MIDFASPWFLLLLLVVARWGYVQLHSAPTAALRYSSVARIKASQPKYPRNPFHILTIIRLMALVLLVMALARPRAGERQSQVKSEGIDILIALDTSGSMRAVDLTSGSDKNRNRMDVAKQVAKEFVQGRTTDRIGLVVFGQEAYTQCPLTLDYGVLTSFLDRAAIGMAGDGTALGSAIGVGTSRLKAVPGKSRVMILVTDGRNTAGRIPPVEAARAAAAFGVKIYTVGVGSDNAFLPVDTLLGKQLIPQPLDLDEDTMKAIAERTGGRYFRATDAESLRQTYETIDALERTEVKIEEHMEYTELYPWLVWPGLLLLLAEMALAQTRLRRLP